MCFIRYFFPHLFFIHTWSSSINIPNPGFETDALLDATKEDWKSMIPTHWNLYDPNNIYDAAEGNIGLINYGPDPAEGAQSVYIGHWVKGEYDLGIEQQLDTLIAANTLYTLTVALGNPVHYKEFPGYRIELLSSNTILKSTGNVQYGPAENQWESIVLTVDPLPITSEYIGQNILIRLILTNEYVGDEVYFDWVRLDAQLITGTIAPTQMPTLSPTNHPTKAPIDPATSPPTDPIDTASHDTSDPANNPTINPSTSPADNPTLKIPSGPIPTAINTDNDDDEKTTENTDNNSRERDREFNVALLLHLEYIVIVVVSVMICCILIYILIWMKRNKDIAVKIAPSLKKDTDVVQGNIVAADVKQTSTQSVNQNEAVFGAVLNDLKVVTDAMGDVIDDVLMGDDSDDAIGDITAGFEEDEDEGTNELNQGGGDETPNTGDLDMQYDNDDDVIGCLKTGGTMGRVNIDEDDCMVPPPPPPPPLEVMSVNKGQNIFVNAADGDKEEMDDEEIMGDMTMGM